MVKKEKQFNFGGFGKTDGIPHKMKDFPPRELPKPISDRPIETWTPEVPLPEKNTQTKNGIIYSINLILPVIGIGLLLGGIGIVIYFVYNIYN